MSEWKLSHQGDDWYSPESIAYREGIPARARAAHQARLAARKAERDAKKAYDRQGGDFIGPPNPYLYRKGRPPMTTTRS
jgi:hypothetical protein